MGDELIDDLARAILDGTPVDWTSAESGTDEATRLLLRQLRTLAAVAHVHREVSTTEGTRSGAGHAIPLRPDTWPERWGHLRILEPIGRGAFGQVYRAWDDRLDREVALKLLPARTSSNERAASSIIHEGRLLARVRHSNVVTIYGAERIDNQIGLWMEFVRGRTLEQLLNSGTVFSSADAAAIGVELCRAVGAVHDAGLLHRDIKTHNVIRAEDGRVVLMDFGTGREVAETTASDLTGTPLYLAPEILRGEPATVRSDIYSLGVLLYHLLSGAYPVQAGTMPDMRLAHERQARTPIADLRPDLPETMARAIDRAIDPVAERRQPTAHALAAELALPEPAAIAPRTAGWRSRAALAALFLILAIAAGDTPSDVRARPVNEPHAALLVGAFGGRTSDTDLAVTLEQAVMAELEQSPYLTVFSPVRIREALARMERPPGTAIDEATGLEICAREGLAAMLSGSVDAIDGLYLVRLRVLQAGTGSVIAHRQQQSRSREEALQSAMTMARQLRQQLGESLQSVQATSPPLELVTSQSFEAVRYYSLGKSLYDREQPEQALPHFLNAIAADAGFAMAHEYAALSYGYLGERDRQRHHLDVAARLASDRVSPIGQLERLKILADRESYLERYHEAAAHLQNMLRLRPGDGRILTNLGLVYGSSRQYPDAIKTLEQAVQAYPHPRVRWMLADMYTSAGRAVDAVALLSQDQELPYARVKLVTHLQLADRQADAESALTEATGLYHRTSGTAWSELALVQADVYRSGGRFREAEDALRQGLDRGGRGGVERLELAMASLLIDWNRPREAAAHLRKIDVQVARNRIVHGVLASRAGDLEAAAAGLARLEQEAADRQAPRPEARVHQLRAEIALATGRAAEAHIHAVRAVRAFPTAWTFETLARAQQAAGMTAEAIETWTTILERRGERATNDWDAPAVSQVVLAHYRLARLLDRAGRAPDARAHYDEFLRLWDRSDPDLPVVVDARERRRRLGQGAQATPAGRVPKPAA